MNGAADRDIAVFTEALCLPPEERARYLHVACKGDAEFRHRVDALLHAYEQAGDFLGRPAADRPAKAAQAFPAGEKPGDCIGHYKLLQQIGEGGYGVVYMAEQEAPVRRRVALKIIKPGMDTKNVIARFEAERQALALMDHSNIAKVFDAGATESGRPYFVMELVRGVKITEYCDQHSLTTNDRLKLFVQVCQAVQHAHQRGIIHRDIKPSNILVAQSLEGTALPMVIDFGVAKATTDQPLTDKTVFTAFEMLIGTPAYMSPEQAALSSVDVDTRTDIYSLGVLLYELLTGSTPFETGELLKAGLDEIRRVIREQEPIRPSTRLSKMAGTDLTTVAQRRQSEPPRLIHTIRGDLDWIAMKAMEKDRTRRYDTANDLASDVKRFLENEPVSARPPSRLYKLNKLMLRNRLLFLGIGILALLLVVSLIVVSTLLGRERQARRDSDSDKRKAQQVTTFLEDMLQSVGPSVALGRDTTMLQEILDRTAARVEIEMTNQPAVEAELRGLIGRVYYAIGNYTKAEGMYRAALAINRKLFGEENDEVATSLSNLADVCRHLGKVEEALALIREALRIREKLFGTQSLKAADSLRGLCILLGDQGKRVESETTAREVLAIRRKQLGPDDPLVASSLDDLAWAMGCLGKLQEAESLEREALAIRQKVLDNEHPDVAKSLYLLGDRKRQQGSLKEAYPLLSAALSIQRKVLPEDHPATLYTLKSLGLMYEAQKQWSEAETVFRQVSAAWRKRAGNDDPETLYAMRDLGITLEYEGKWAEAENVHREALASWIKRAGNDDPQTVYTLDRLVWTLEGQAKWSEAENVYRERLASRRKGAGNEAPQTLSEIEGLAKVLMRQKKFGETEQLLDEALTPAMVRQPSSCNLLIQRVELMGRQGRWEEAATTAALVVECQPTDPQYRYFTLAALLAITRDRPAYEMLCQKMLTTFTNTSNPYVDDRIAKGCLLLPDSGVDLQFVDNLADKAVSLGSGSPDALPYFQVAKAESAYRLGHFAESVEWAEKTLTSSIIYANAHAYAILAMAHWKLGHKDVARAVLDKGDSLTPNIIPSHQPVDLGDSWVAWLFARISLDEAAALIHSASKTDSNSRKP